jgi:hypothetical protein
MMREQTDAMCRDMGRPITLAREGLPDAAFRGVIRGLGPDELVGSAEQADMLCIIPAAQIAERAPRKFDRIVANGRTWTVQFVRECYDGIELCSYKAIVRG